MVEDYFFGPNGLANQNNENVANENDPTGSSKKRVIVFHCEFSSERAPAMLRFLRKMDRAKNRYPALDFPELYLLKDGYKVIILSLFAKTLLYQKWVIFEQKFIFNFRLSSMVNRQSVQQRAHTFQCLIRDTLKN